MYRNNNTKGSWEGASRWYTGLLGDKGHYYHDHVVLPGVLRLLGLKKGDSLLDLACGNGILSKKISEDIFYTGVDISPSLIKTALGGTRVKNREFLVGDVSKNLQLNKHDFSHASVVLAIQNIKEPKGMLINAALNLKPGGTLAIVMNHPAFRIPRQSMWEIDEKNKLQYRRINRYLSPLEIPINIHPGQNNSPVTWDFHYPISTYTKWLSESGFWIESMEEWVSDKESEGRMAKAENRARNEIPLFLAIKAVKK